MKPKVLILGAGMVGKAMAIDLCKNYDVTSADISEESLNFLNKEYGISTIIFDVTQWNSLRNLVKNFDLVISAVPGFLGYKTVETIIEGGVNLVDISFMPEDTLQLNEKAIKNNVTAIVDCGVAPGMPNLIAGYQNTLMEINNFQYMVGGLPKVRTFPFEYKAPFSPIDVIEEYTRPARFLQNNHIIVKPPMSDTELINFDKAGTLEAFNTDGLRSLIFTLKNIPNISEKTLRYPGHIKLIQSLGAAGFFSHTPVNVKGADVKPVDFTNNLLFKSWKLEPEDEEFTVMRVTLQGKINGENKEVVYDLYDEYDHPTKISSMARTTGYTATAAASMFLDGLFSEKGIFPPELIGKHHSCFDYMMKYLEERHVIYTKTVKDI